MKHTEEQLKAWFDNLSGADARGMGAIYLGAIYFFASENPDVAKKSGGAGALKILQKTFFIY